MKVGFITPNNKKILMNYDEVEEYCKELCLQEENYEKFLAFSKKYTYFNPYFDFVLVELKYIFINPLLKENTYLKSFGEDMYFVEAKTDDYSYISEYAKSKKRSEYYQDMVCCSDKKLNIKKFDNAYNISSWLIDPNGYTMIANSSEHLPNHEITGNTIVNQILISHPNIYTMYSELDYSLVFLVEYFGFLRTTDLAGDGIIIGFNRILCDKLKEIKTEIMKNPNNIYSDFEKHLEHSNRLDELERLEKLKKIEKALDYQIGREININERSINNG